MSPMGAYGEELCVLGYFSDSVDGADPIVLPANVDVRGYTKICAIAYGVNIPYDNGIVLFLMSGTGPTYLDLATIESMAYVRNPGLTQDLLVTDELHESMLTSGQFYVNAIFYHSDEDAPHELGVILLGGFPREKACVPWEPETTSTPPPLVTTTTGLPTTTTTTEQ